MLQRLYTPPLRGLVLLLSLPLCLFGCSGGKDDNAGSTAADDSSGSGSGGATCTPGVIDACLCPDMSPSTQICFADGSGFSACDCVGMSGPGEDSGDSAVTGGGSATSDDGSSSDSGSTGGSTSTSSTSSTSSGNESTGPAPECDGSHPLVDGDLRYCEAGDCYCGDFMVEPPFDVCYAMDIAEACCPVDVVCY